jgi:hypothetical protein
MLRKSLLIALSILGGVAVAQEQSAKFSFKAPAAPAKRVFEELSKATGTSMVASGSVADDVLLLNLSDVTLTDTMDKIASTLHAEWRKEGSGWVLYRGANFEAADRRTEASNRVAEFRTNLNRILDAQQKMGAFNDATAKQLVDQQRKMEEEAGRAQGAPIRISGSFTNVAQQTPASRAIATLLSRMTDAQVAALTSGNRAVFSINPTRMQLPMPNGASQVMQQFLKDSAIYRDVSQRNQPAANPNEGRRVVINGFGGDGGGDGDPSLGIGYAMLISMPNQLGSNVNVTLLVADPNGRTLATGQFYVGGQMVTTAQIPTQSAAEEKALPLSETAKELAKVLGQTMGGPAGRGASIRMVSSAVGGGSFSFSSLGGDGKTPQVSDDLRQRILNPELYDPLSISAGEAMSLTADAKGKDLVAYIPDNSFMSLTQSAGTSPTASSFLTSLSTAGMVAKDEGSWMLVSPRNPSAARDRKVNRAALGAALKVLNSKGYLSLDDWAAFARKQAKSPRFGEIDVTFFRLVNTPAAESGLNQFDFGGGWQTLQFYASLTGGQKQTMAQSGRIPLANITNYQMGLVSEQVFNSFEGPNVINRQDQAGRPVAFMLGMASAQTERTLLLPSGIPRDGFLTLTLRTNEIVQANSTSSGGARFFNAEGLAFERVRGERPELASFGPSVQYDQYRMASQRTIGMLFQFTPEVSLSRQLEDNSPGNNAFAPYDRLPAEFKKKVDAAFESLSRGWSGGGGPGRVPPPSH